MCWIIPLIVGIISAILGYLLGKRYCQNSPEWMSLQDENTNLRHKLKACEERSHAQPVTSSFVQQDFTDNQADVASSNHHFVAFDAGLAQAVFGKKIKQDDLTLVEGIGPKIAELFQDAGIRTWQDLAETSVERCREILDAAGTRFAVHEPDTWPKQAQLAAEGKWQELLDWQDKLDGGREV